MIKARFLVLYKSGHEDVIEQEATEEDFEQIVSFIRRGLKDEMNGLLTFGDQAEQGHFIRLSDVSRVKMEIVGIRH